MKTKLILYYLSTLISLVLLISVPDQIETESQSNANTNPGSSNWLQIVFSGVLAAIISTGTSTFVNYKITLTELKTNHKNAMKQLETNYAHTLEQFKKERHIEETKETLAIYSYIIYQLEKVLNTSFRDENQIKEIKTIIHEVDDAIKNKFFLLDPSLVTQWMRIIDMRIEGIKLTDEIRTTDFLRKQSNNFKIRVLDFKKSLMQEYNNSIVPQYESIVGKAIQKITDTKELSYYREQ